jgi:hypothetical protein
MIVASSGTFNIQFSAQLTHTSGGDETIDIWLRKNGTDVARSNTRYVLAAKGFQLASWNWVVSASANDYFEIVLSAPDTDIKLDASVAATSPTRPATPSMIVTVFAIQSAQQAPSSNIGALRSSKYYFFHDFETTGVQPLTTTFSATSGASLLQSGAYSGTNNTHGNVGIYTGTATNGRGAIHTHLDLMYFGTHGYTLETLSLLSNTSDATDRYTAVIGFLDGVTSATPTDAVFFRYSDNVNSGKWECVCRSHSGISATAGAFVKFKIIVNAAGTSVTFYINDNLVATVATNIPTTSSRTLGYGMAIYKSAGTNSRSFHHDYIYVQGDLATNR